MKPKTFAILAVIFPIVSIIAGAAVYLNMDAKLPPAMTVKTDIRSVEATSSMLSAEPPPSLVAPPAAPRSKSHGAKADFPQRTPQSNFSPNPSHPKTPSDHGAADSADIPSSSASNDRPEGDSTALSDSRTRGPSRQNLPVVSGVGVYVSAPPRQLPLPLAFQDLDPEIAELNPTQSKALSALRENFIKEVGGPNQNAADPRYAKRWNDSQPVYDRKLRILFGDAYANRAELEAAQNAYAATHPANQ